MAKAKPKKKTPQPPPAWQQAAPQPAAGGGGGYNVGYTPTLGTQMQTPYNDAMAAGAYQALPATTQNVGATAGAAGQSLGAYSGMMQNQNPQVANAMQSRLMNAYNGQPIFDPYISSQLDQQQQQLHQNLARTLGPDYQATAAGQNAMARFQEMRNHTEASAQQQAIQGLNSQWMDMVNNTANQGATLGAEGYTQGIGLGNQMFGGQANQQALASGQMNLMSGVASNMMGAGQGMSNLSTGSVNAQQPYEVQAGGQFAASQFPTHKQMMGMNMVQSGNQWSNIGTADVGAGSSGNAPF